MEIVEKLLVVVLRGQAGVGKKAHPNRQVFVHSLANIVIFLPIPARNPSVFWFPVAKAEKILWFSLAIESLKSVYLSDKKAVLRFFKKISYLGEIL